ncbi:hypothetical protein D6855_05510 [Butyrivibrio sp. CB08]|nr:hypothetical protein D6855_05510 [Butyrivibrio sp. CB08]
MVVHSSGDLVCPYCGTKENFSDAELAEYKKFRIHMLEYLKACSDADPDPDKTDRMWDRAEQLKLKSKDGEEVVVSYLYKTKNGQVSSYFTRYNVIYHFPADFRNHTDINNTAELHGNLTSKAIAGLGKLNFPQADLKHLEKCFPQYSGTIVLSDGGMLLVFNKPEEFYPLELFGALEKEHVAWIISRLENICCVLEYSGICHGDICPDTICINPRTHEAMLFGAWWAVTDKKTSLLPSPNTDLVAIRKTARMILGYEAGQQSGSFEKFLKDKPTCDAYKDFENWDKVIEDAFGGRRFTKMNY